jgi:hypothetical protein
MALLSVHIVLDQGLPRDAAAELRRMGLECTHVGEVGMSKAADPDILEWARAQRWVLGINGTENRVKVTQAGGYCPCAVAAGQH